MHGIIFIFINMYIFNILVLFRYNTAMNNNRFSIYSSIIKSDIIKTVYEELIKKTNRLIQIWDEYIELKIYRHAKLAKRFN